MTGAVAERAVFDGISVFCSQTELRRGATFRSELTAGLWFGVMVSGGVETEEPNFGRRRWSGRNATMFWAPETTPSDHHVLADGALASLFVHFTADHVERLRIGRDDMPPGSGLVLQAGDRRGERLHRLARDVVRNSGPLRRYVMLAAARQAVAELLDEAGLAGRLAGAADNELPEAEVVRIYRARELLLADLRNPPTIAELARLTGTNARKLSLGFRALYGQPPFAYLKAYRLEQALAALRRGERSVQAIAAEVGYRPAHLAAAFHRRFGRPPSAYEPDDFAAK